MREAPSVSLVWATFPDLECARRVCKTLVQERLAACVNLIPQLESIYTWNEKLEMNSEVGAWIKSTPGRYSELEARYRALHPYEVPALVAISVESGLPEYLRWVAASCDSITD